MMKMYLMRLACLLLLSLILAACAGKKSAQITKDLWMGWEEADLLMQPDYPDAVPILLVHGWNGDEFTWPNGARLLAMEQKLGRDIYYFNYRTGALPNRYPPLEAMEEHLERYLKSFPVVDVVAHSMGGLLVRQYLTHHGGHNIRRLLFLSVPHYGADAANVLAGLASVAAIGNVQAQEIQPGSDFLWQLNSLEGSELDGIEVLNAYTVSEGRLDGDLILSPVSAWLPWASNVTVAGDHHTLPSELDNYPFVADFLQQGVVSISLVQQPLQRDLWVRVSDVKGAPLMFSEASVKRKNNEQDHWSSAGLDICCSLRSSMTDNGISTVLATDVKAGAVLRLIDRSSHPNRVILVDLADIHTTLPVTLVERSLASPSASHSAP
ncbi:MAG: hypothetical protein R8K50_05630 [Mariprofundus sp.]